MFLIGSNALAQENDYDYTTEKIFGINKNTASGLIGGFVFRYSKAIRERYFTTYGFELMNVRHPAEARVVSRSGSSFIIGKVNNLYTIRAQYGRTLTLYKKASQQGVQIDLIGAIGPSIGLQSPYYIEYAGRVRVPYDPSIHRVEDITGRGYLFQGLFQSKVIIGFNAKFGMNFEFGTFKSSVSGFEIGFLLDAYTQKVYMIAEAENYAVWPTAYVTIFYGSRK